MRFLKNLRGEYEAYKDWLAIHSSYLAWAKQRLGENEVAIVKETIAPGRFAFYGHDAANKKILRSKKRLALKEKAVLMLCEAGGFSRVAPALGFAPAGFLEKEGWAVVFKSPLCEVWELKSRYEPDKLPLRFGLNFNEKQFLLISARRAVTHFLLSGARPALVNAAAVTYQRLNQVVSLDVALWVNGMVRGSIIKNNVSLLQGVSMAAAEATRDSRFKPVTMGDLENLRIEITVFSSLRLPLGCEAVKKNDIYTDKGYFLSAGKKYAWFLPQVFNAVKFTSLKDFLVNLIKKAGLQSSMTSEAKIEIFEVVDFAESRKKDAVLEMTGPLIGRLVYGTKIEETKQNFGQVGKDAADWLCRLEEPSGFMPAIINRTATEQISLDWPRILFVAWALAEFGKISNQVSYTNTASRLISYGKKMMVQTRIDAEKQILSQTYMGKAVLALGETSGADLIAKKIFHFLASGGKLSTTTTLQIASFFLSVAKVPTDRYGLMGEKMFEQILNKFLTRSKLKLPVSLAEYAELVTIAYGFSTNKANYPKRNAAVHGATYKKIIAWYAGLQRENGAFPDTPQSSFIYTRGTGKIFEALAVDMENYPILLRSMDWLSKMQFTEEVFFVPQSLRPRFLGGFRHDMLNSDAWIDSAGHLILGISRLKQNGQLQ